jgi:recombination protein RecT
MGTAANLKAVATGTAVAEKPKDLAHLLASPGVQLQIKAALPRHMTAERMARIATTEMRKVPKLGQCDPMSFLGAVIQCAQLGLEPGNALGHAYILPFDKREKVGNQWKTVRTEAQVIIGYRGMIDLARRSGQIVSIDARAVYEGDKFDCQLGLDAKIEHVPDWQNANRADAAKLRFVYAVAKLKDGGVQFDVMSRSEVESIRARSKSADNGPWVTDFAAMAVKTVVRRLFKFLPVSIEMQTAVGLDEMAEAGMSQQNSAVIDGDFAFVDEPPALTDDPSPTVDVAGYEKRIAECKDLAMVQVLSDEIDPMPTEARERLMPLLIARDKELAGAR